MTKFLTLTAILFVMCCATAEANMPDRHVRAERQEGDAGASNHDLVQGAHVEGHIAFLKAELGITPEQDALWQPVANAMREDVRNLQDAENRVRQTQRPDNAIDYLENRVMFAKLRAQGESRFLEALRPLYGNLSDQQKRVADELLIHSQPE